MSLINQVLKGLESRKDALPTSGPTEDLQWVNNEEQKTNYLLIGSLVVGFITLSAGSLLGIQWLYDQSVIPSPTTVTDPQSISESLPSDSEDLSALATVELPELLSSSVDIQELSDSSIMQDSLETEIVLSPSIPNEQALIPGTENSDTSFPEEVQEIFLASLPNGENRIHAFRYSNTETEARLVFELDHTLAHELQVDEDLRRHRLYLPDVYLPESQHKTLNDDGLVNSIQYGGTEQDLELVIETRAPTTVYSYFLTPDDRYARHRLVLDLMARPQSNDETSAGRAKRTALVDKNTDVQLSNNDDITSTTQSGASPVIEAKPTQAPKTRTMTQSPATDNSLVPATTLVNNKAVTKVSEPASSSTTLTKSAPPLRTANRIPRKLTPTEIADRHYHQALKFIEQKQDTEAYNMLSKALEHSPDHIAARERLLDLLMRTGRISEAENGLRDALRMHPKQSSFAKLYARILVERNNVGGAIYILEDAKPAVADDPEYHAFLAAMYQRQGNHEKAVELYQSVVTEHPFNGVWWMGLAISQEHTREIESAVNNYNQALFREGLSPELITYIQSRLKQLQLN